MDGIYRIKGGQCLRDVAAPGFARVLVPVDDPEVAPAPWDAATARVTLPAEHRIPPRVWAPWVKLAFSHARGAGGETREVGVLLLRSATPPSADWRILVPRQTVGGASLTYRTDEMIDIVTGEKYDGIPSGWLRAGTSHSHNEMGAFFSGTDDRDELGQPGVHIVVGSIDHKAMTYSHKARVVHARREYAVDFDALVDATPLSCHYHASVLALIDERSPVVLALQSKAVGYGYHHGGYHGAWTAADEAAWREKWGMRDDTPKRGGSRGKRRNKPFTVSGTHRDQFSREAVEEIREAAWFLRREDVAEAYAILADREAELAADDGGDAAAREAADADEVTEDARREAEALGFVPNGVPDPLPTSDLTSDLAAQGFARDADGVWRRKDVLPRFPVDGDGQERSW